MLRHRKPSPLKWPLAKRRVARRVDDEDPEDWVIDGPGEDKAPEANATVSA